MKNKVENEVGMENLLVHELEELIEKYEKKIRDAKDIIWRKKNEKFKYLEKWFSSRIKFKITEICYFKVLDGAYYRFKHIVENTEICILIGSWMIKNTYCEIHEIENGEVGKRFHNYCNYPHLQEIYEYYNKEENIKKLFAQTDKIIKLCEETNYLNNLPKAYTFLLSSPFCRDITKLITQKILFFKN